MSVLESGDQRYIQAINNNNNNSLIQLEIRLRCILLLLFFFLVFFFFFLGGGGVLLLLFLRRELFPREQSVSMSARRKMTRKGQWEKKDPCRGGGGRGVLIGF